MLGKDHYITITRQKKMTEIVGEWLEGCLRKEQGHEL